ncbi:MAG: DUF2163 domain-containing protein [Rhodoferax sp.]|nr:DUF2163 domain-containing protein [Rhodoferax sp.]MDP3650528.1 DUF2163 domain-containing protein [Rhodoferax sp.]
MIIVLNTLATHLDGDGPFLLADLYLIAMPNGVLLRWTSFDVDVSWAGYTWSANCPVLTRGTTRVVIGVEVDTLDLTIAPRASDMVAGLPLLAAARSGAFDGARLTLYRAFLNADRSAIGAVIRFVGRFADVDFGRSAMAVRVNSAAEDLSVQLPRNTYSPTCGRTLYAAGCDVSRAANTVTATVGAGSTSSKIICALSGAATWWDQGGMQFTSGALLGTRRTVKNYASGVLALFSPLAASPAVGDTFEVYPGCDKTLETCEAKFNNRAKFRGCPFIPIAETGL